MSPLPSPSIAVVKVGGSLLTWEGLPGALARVLSGELGADRAVVVVGGGIAADAVREFDRVHGLGDEAAHWLALRAMDLTARCVVELNPDYRLAETEEELQKAWSCEQIPIFAPRVWLEDRERRGLTSVPHSWDATSDSIAALVAVAIQARQLILMKSAPLGSIGSREGAASAGLVDACFVAQAGPIAVVRYLHAKDPQAEPVTLDQERLG